MTATKQSPQPVTAQAPQSTSSTTPSILTSAGDALLANTARLAWAVQNLGTNPLYVRIDGGVASATVFNFILKGSTVQDDGTSPPFSDEVWKGRVSVAGTSPRFVVTELT